MYILRFPQSFLSVRTLKGLIAYPVTLGRMGAGVTWGAEISPSCNDAMSKAEVSRGVCQEGGHPQAFQ